MTIGVYVITNKLNNKRYVGASVNVESRSNVHLQGRGNRLIADDLKDGFKIDIIECDKTELDELEQFLIEECNSIYPNGYNLQSGGKTGFIENDITKQHKSDRQVGKTQSTASNEKRSETMIGVAKTEEHKMNISKARKGITFSKEHRDKLSKAKKGKAPWNKGLSKSN
jgi:group I intron endonuclease